MNGILYLLSLIGGWILGRAEVARVAGCDEPGQRGYLRRRRLVGRWPMMPQVPLVLAQTTVTPNFSYYQHLRCQRQWSCYFVRWVGRRR